MTNTRCLTAAMLEVGMTHSARLSFSHDEVARYCDLTHDHNAIHRDLAAAQLRFPGIRDIVVPGGLVQTRISALFGTELPGDGTLGLSFTPERLRRPLCPGDELVVTLTVARIIRGGLVDMDIEVTDAEGTPITTGKARVVAADAAYRAWWETQQGG